MSDGRQHTDDAVFLQRCLDLARRGAGNVSPNPMVGSVIVHDGQVIGEGWHEQYGGPHAEVNAIASVADQELLRESTLYVNLEPCSHFGKTPPCCDLIIARRLKRVVVGCLDPFEAVSGRGVEKLRQAGIPVTVGVLREESERLNEAFLTYHGRKRPFVMLKVAQTLDGRIATSLGVSKWITGEASRDEVHRLRSTSDAVLSTSSTVIADGAELTVRRHAARRQPLRVLLDRHLQVPFDSPVYNDRAGTLVFMCPEVADPERVRQLEHRGIEVVGVGQAASGLDLDAVFSELYRRQVLSVMVEAGGRLAASLVRAKLVDKLQLFIAPRLFGGDGLPSFATLDVQVPGASFNLRFSSVRMAGQDIVLEGYMV